MSQQDVTSKSSQSISPIEAMRQMLERLDTELTELESLFAERTTRDDLTGVLRRNAFSERSEALLQECRDHGSGFGVLLLDLDHFKRLNDTFGHQAGDEALRRVGKLLRSYEGPDRVVCRYGGEEFAIAMRGEPLALAEEIRLRLEQFTFARGAASCTVSIGTRIARDGESIQELLEQADRALYRAKSLGRNRVEAA